MSYEHIVFNSGEPNHILVQHHKDTGGVSISERNPEYPVQVVLLDEDMLDEIAAIWIERRKQ